MVFYLKSCILPGRSAVGSNFYHRHTDKTADAELSMARAILTAPTKRFANQLDAVTLFAAAASVRITSSKVALQNCLPDQTQQRKKETRCAVGALSSTPKKCRSQCLVTAGLQRDTRLPLQISPYPKPRPRCLLLVGWQRWFFLQIR